MFPPSPLLVCSCNSLKLLILLDLFVAGRDCLLLCILLCCAFSCDVSVLAPAEAANEKEHGTADLLFGIQLFGMPASRTL
jgi:hypothetical protein